MATKLILTAISGLIAGLAIGYSCGGFRPPSEPVTIHDIRTDTVTVRDTVRITGPERIRTKIRTDTILLETVNNDTVTVPLPIEQQVYGGTGWRAVISGYRPWLDTLMIDRQQLTRTIKEPPSRWSIGLQAGYGLTPRGFQPYIGAGVTFRLGR